MARILTLVAVLAAVALPALATERRSIAGDYVEARTAEVFTGGCIMGSEAETVGRQAVLAWHVTEGSFDGVPLAGLSVVAAVAGDRNLGIREIGGEAPTRTRAAVLVDERATDVQRAALMAFVRAATGSLITDVVETKAAPIRFEQDARAVRVNAGEVSLDVQTSVRHDPNCGAMQWFHPLALTDAAHVGMTRTQVYSGRALGSRWRQVDRKSAFVGTFALAAPATD